MCMYDIHICKDVKAYVSVYVVSAAFPILYCYINEALLE